MTTREDSRACMAVDLGLPLADERGMGVVRPRMRLDRHRTPLADAAIPADNGGNLLVSDLLPMDVAQIDEGAR